MAKFTRLEMQLLNSAITMEMQSEEPQISFERAKVLRERVMENTMKTIEQLNESELRELVYDLMRESADVQGVEVEEYCKDMYGLEW